MKKSLILTIITFLLYFVQSITLSLLTGTFNLAKTQALCISVILVLIIVFIIIRKKEIRSYYGICLGMYDDTKTRKYITLLTIISFINIPYLFLVKEFDIINTVIESIFIGIMEELIFRGFLFRFVQEKSNITKAIILSSIFFSLYYLVNIGSYHLIFVILQLIYAFSIGIVFSIVLYKTKSLLLCIISHTLVDVLGTFAIEPLLIIEVSGTVICVLLAVFSFLSFKKENITSLHT